jgi:exonuclease SbcC
MVLRTHMNDIRSAFKKLKKEEYETKIQKYEQIVSKKNILVNQNNSLSLELTKLKENIKWHHENLKKYQIDYERLETIYMTQENTSENNDLMNLCDSKIKMLKKEEAVYVRILNKIAELKAGLKSLQRDQKTYEILKEKNRCFDLLSNAVSKKGIPLHIINKMLPAINAEITKILAGVVPFTVDIESDLDTNSLDVFINYGDSKRIIELASGMEKMMASLAIRVALINVSSLSKTTMLMIDEGFGTLDATNLEACNRLLISLKKWFKNIVVISHVDVIKDCVDHNIDIIKKGIDSYVYHP